MIDYTPIDLAELEDVAFGEKMISKKSVRAWIQAISHIDNIADTDPGGMLLFSHKGEGKIEVTHEPASGMEYPIEISHSGLMYHYVEAMLKQKFFSLVSDLKLKLTTGNTNK